MLRKLIIMNEYLLPWRREERDPWYFDHVSCRISEKHTTSTKSWPVAFFPWSKSENFIFLLKYWQRKVDQKTSEKSLVFVKEQRRKFYLYVQLWNTKILYLRKTMLLQKDAAFLHFRLKKCSENIIFP